MKSRIWPLALALTLLSACGGEEAAREQSPPPVFQQELLFLQQGLRQRGIEGSFTVYFAPPEENCQELLLEDQEGLFWQERFTFEWDEERDWYAFSGLFEPVLAQAQGLWSWAKEAGEETAAFRAAAVYQAELSADMDLETPLRFDVPPGPVVYDRQWGGGQEAPARMIFRLYLYQDPRLSFTAEIEYPQYVESLVDFPDPEAVNERIREAFFYGYGGNSFRPEGETRGEIVRHSAVTRADGRLLSLRIWESNCFMAAPHPNNWYSCLTLNLETGEALSLRDILGPERTVEELLDSGAFRCNQVWEEGPDREGAERLQIEEAKSLIHPDSTENFYLTGDSLGLVSTLGRYPFYMEAPLSALGLEDWASRNLSGSA
ncbi:MAG: hypothetical protein K2L38_07345 [Dysosmobacter sp.]|nr:hypothetical protein [Dysosmobacter sp.]